ncbi:MAG TPA: pitrilysin family protein [Alphaproteobacteria bacterium]|jgi:predicted Zn-dependent peptidase
MSVRITTLPSGLRVVTDHIPHVESAAVGVWVNVGARHEAAEINGVAHLLEHMAFKGTEKRDARRIAEEIEAVGGSLNAYTSRENTAYFARVLKGDVPLAVDILSDILQNSTFDETELTRERAVIIQEIGQSFDTPEDVIFDQFQEVLYPEQPLGRPILGSEALINTIPRAEIASYMKQNYMASGMVLAAAGNVDHAALVAQAEGAFTEIGRGAPPKAIAARYAGGERYENRDLEQVHLVLGFDGVAYGDPDYYAMSVLAYLLGGGMSSRLFQEIREKRGLVYSIYSFTSSYHDGGNFGVYAGTGEKEVDELVPVLCDEINKVAVAIDADELERTKAQMRAGLLMSLESTSSRCERLAQNMVIYGRIFTYQEIIEKIDAVDEAAVMRAAQRMLRSKPTVAALGPVGRLERMAPISARFS